MLFIYKLGEMSFAIVRKMCIIPLLLSDFMNCLNRLWLIDCHGEQLLYLLLTCFIPVLISLLLLSVSTIQYRTRSALACFSSPRSCYRKSQSTLPCASTSKNFMKLLCNFLSNAGHSHTNSLREMLKCLIGGCSYFLCEMLLIVWRYCCRFMLTATPHSCCQ